MKAGPFACGDVTKNWVKAARLQEHRCDLSPANAAVAPNSAVEQDVALIHPRANAPKREYQVAQHARARVPRAREVTNKHY